MAELTQTGVLTVRWDRKIEMIESFAALPQEKVMVKWSAEQEGIEDEILPVIGISLQNNLDLTELPLDWEVVKFDSD